MAMWAQNRRVHGLFNRIFIVCKYEVKSYYNSTPKVYSINTSLNTFRIATKPQHNYLYSPKTNI